MRLVITLVVLNLFTYLSVFAQSDLNRWSLETNVGLNNATQPFADGYSSNYLGFLHADLNVRRMFNRKLGLSLGWGFDRIKNDEMGNIQGPQDPTGQEEFVVSKEFETHYFRLSLQGVVNLRDVLDLYTLDKNFTIFMHGGFGFSSLKDKKRSVWFKDWRTQGSDEMMHLMFGLTPTYRLHDNWTINLDFTIVGNAWQSKTWDFTENSFEKGLHGRIWNFSVGTMWYFGKNGQGKKHVDWSPTTHSLEGTDDHVRDTVKTIETIRTIETVSVNGRTVEKEKGVAPDVDGDGVPDAEDDCPSVFGRGANGCPNFDTDGDGVPDAKDECPTTPGIIENNGCPQLDLKVKQVFTEVRNDVEFVNNSDEFLDGTEEVLEKLFQVIIEHPEFRIVEILGHTSNAGYEEPNRILSLARAEKVKAYLVSKGISDTRIKTFGYGGDKPIASNDNPAGRKQNERIDIKVKY